MKTYNKLVRDKIPIIINNDIGDGVCKFHIADQEEFFEKLCEKLNEELIEFIQNPSAEEIADMLEIVEAMAKLHNISIQDIRVAKINKKKNRGGFNERIILEEAPEPKEEKPTIERDGSHVHLNMGNTKKLSKDFKTSGEK